MTRLAFSADLLHEIPCTLMTNQGITFLAPLDNLCTNLPAQQGPIKRAHSSNVTSTTTTSVLTSAVVTPVVAYASVVEGTTSFNVKREPYRSLVDNINDPTDPIVIPDDADANNNAVIARQPKICDPPPLAMGTLSLSCRPALLVLPPTSPTSHNDSNCCPNAAAV